MPGGLAVIRPIGLRYLRGGLMSNSPEATGKALKHEREPAREETVEACALTAILYSTHEEVEELFSRRAKRSCRG